MDIVKKNLLSIIAGVVALAALIAWIWPLGSIKDEQQTKLGVRVKAFSSMQSLLTKERRLPSVSLSGEEDKKLGMFPTQKVIDWGKGLREQLKEQGVGVRAVALVTNLTEMSTPNLQGKQLLRPDDRPLLVSGTLPKPQDDTFPFTFRDEYAKYVRVFPKLVGSGIPPTQAEIEAVVKDIWKTKYEPQLIVRDGRVETSSQQQVEAEFNKERELVPDRVRTERARSILFYMDPATAMDVSASILNATSVPPTTVAIWEAQMKLWIQNNMGQAIVDLNRRESKMGCVIDAPVKSLLKIVIESPRGSKTGGSTGGGMPSGGMGGPPMMGGMPSGGMGGPPMMGGMPSGGMGGVGTASRSTGSFTDRTSTSMYDVIPVKLTVHIELDKLPMFLEELGRNRFVTVYQVSIQTVDSVIIGIAQNVIYGSSPVVQATISCEALLLREWTVPLMPPEIQAAYGVEVGGGSGAQPPR